MYLQPCTGHVERCNFFYNAMNVILEGNGNLPDDFTLSAIKLMFHKQ